MKLSEIKRDAVAIEQGQWVDNIPEMGDLRLKVRGADNADWRRIQAKLVAAVPPAKRMGGRIDPEEADRITSICLQSACLLDWDGLIGEDDQPLPFSRDLAGDLLTKPEFRAFRDAVLWAATVVGQQAAVRIEEAAKN